MSPNRSVAGMVVHLPDEALRLGRMAAAAAEPLARCGYARIEAPIIEPLQPFLLRSGESLRRSMYAFAGPDGQEVCLRPEMTIPVVRAFVAHMSDAPRPVRLCYDGAVFRHRPAAADRPRQERQLGAELIGAPDASAADAEIVALAYQTGRAIGCGRLRLVLNDFGLISALIRALGMSAAAEARLIDLLAHPAALERELSGQAEPDPSGLAARLSGLERETGIDLVLRLLDGMPLPALGSRQPRQIAERFWDRRVAGGPGRIGSEQRELLRRVAAINGAPRGALAKLSKIAQASGLELSAAIDHLKRLIERLQETGVPESALSLDFGLVRPFSYYTGVAFELRSGGLALGGGGRYDDLVRCIAPGQDANAVGFALSLDAALDAGGGGR